MKTRKLVCGVGVNDADYVTQKFETIIVDGKQKRKRVWICPYYKAWKNMLQRCYSTKYQERQPTYFSCAVSEAWKTFSNFRAWMEKQDFVDKQLDKDLLIEGNKVYSPEMCVFVTQTVNNFTTDRGASRGEWLIGVHWDKKQANLNPSVQTHSQRKSNTLVISLVNKKHMKHGLRESLS